MFCSKCGKKIGEGVDYCQHCGNPLNDSVNISEPVKNTASSFFQSLQEKAKNVSESINAAAEEAKKKAEDEKKAQDEKSYVNAYGEKIVRTTKSSTGMQNGRFKTDGFASGLTSLNGKVIVDRLTGVNYLFVWLGTSDASGLAVLVDENGKPLVTKEDKIEINNTEDIELRQNKEDND